jgi:hypothetical protein
MKAGEAFRLSRIQAEGWKAARELPLVTSDTFDSAAIEALNPYKLAAERERWLAGFKSALERRTV